MKFSRKEFLKLGGGVAGALALSPLTSVKSDSDASKKLKTFGLQLWTVRDDLARDARSVLKQLASMGYKQVESFDNGPKGIYWGMTNKEFKKCLDEVGITMVSTHIVVENEFEKKVAEAAEIGLKYVIFQWEGPGKTIDDYKKYAADFNLKGEYCRKNGIRFGYHNHSFSFQLLNGQIPQEILLKETDPKLVDFQMDFFYVVSTGNDPIEWLERHQGRFRLCHIKDKSRTSNSSCILGQGSIDFPSILKVARDNGMEYYLAEQEDYGDNTPLQCAAADALYMKRLKF